MTLDIEDDLKEWKQYELDHSGLVLQFEQRTISVSPLVHESFNVVQITPGVMRALYGLSGIKEKIRPIVAEGMYDAVIFIYDIEDCEMYKADRNKALDSIANWTYFSPLYPGMPFSEVVVDRDWADRDPFRVFSHEIRHNFCYRLRALGYPIMDQMDSSNVKQPDGTYKWIPYYREYDPYAVDGNRARQNTILTPFWSTLVARLETRSFIKKLQDQIAALLKQITMKTDAPGVIAWAKGIQKHEGWYIGSKSYRNLNPGNFRYTPYVKSLGAIGKDETGFAIFPSFDAGFEALLQFIRDARANQLVAYRNYAISKGRPRNMCTLADFFHVYAPSSDNNDPDAYVRAVAADIGCAISAPIDTI